GTLSPNPAFLRNTLHTWLVKDVRQVASINNTSTEQTEVELVPVDEIERMLVSGEIDHALVVATLWRALHHLRQG
ncbi:MAG: hypothetical protein KDI36_07330, partial [Pseudomonadales bacterium]|nr:hypothetical protein [Pseudomonadales bacterium]